MIAFIRHLNLDRPVVIGHSMGASMTARAAFSFPDQLRAAVLIDPVFHDVSDEDKSSKIDKRIHEIQNLKNLSHKELQDYAYSKHPKWKKIYIESYAMSKIFASKQIYKIIETIDKDWREDLDKAKCPILLITADREKGAIISQDTSNWIRENHPDVETLHVPNVGHSAHRENYPLVFEEINKFLIKQF
jgi:pimeloyl-ACP methyl ester carboxylesterase